MEQMFNVEIDFMHRQDNDDLAKWAQYQSDHYQYSGKVTCEKYGNVATIYRADWSFTPNYIGEILVYIDAGLIGTGIELTDAEETEFKKVLTDILEAEGYTMTLLWEPPMLCG